LTVSVKGIGGLLLWKMGIDVPIDPISYILRPATH
jgi:hypothetical protein